MKVFLTGMEVHDIVQRHLESTLGVKVLSTDTKMSIEVMGKVDRDGMVEVRKTLDGIEAEVAEPEENPGV